MNAMVIFEQMLVLLGMIIVGFLFYNKGVLDDEMEKKLSWLIVNFLNPCLIISSVSGKSTSGASNLIGQNLILVILLYIGYIILSPVLHRVLRVPKERRGLYTLMTTFSNLGFMGLPIIKSIYGDGAAIYVVFYMLTYNVLIYTYGLVIAGKYSPLSKGGIDLKRMLNPGNFGSIIAILLFVFQIQFPDPLQDFLTYFGDAAIPFSMMLIGVSAAKIPWRELVSGTRVYVFCFLKLLVLPILFSFLVKLLPFDTMIQGIFVLLSATPVGSIAIIIANEYEIGGKEGTQAIILSTILSVITMPIVAIMF